jgi:uncharacterized protein YlxW (UPF0749 family)
VSKRSQRVLVSVGATICGVFAAGAPGLESQREAPSYALSNSVVFYLERSLATLLILYVVLAIVIRSVIRGELPSVISKEGLAWPDDVSATREALETLQAQVETLQHDVNEIAERAVLRTSFP